MQAKIPALIAAEVENGQVRLDQVLTPEAVHRVACVQSALVLLTQFSSDGEVFIADVVDLAAYIDAPHLREQ